MCRPIKKKGVSDYASASCSAASNAVNQQTCSHYVSADALKTLLAMKCFVSHDPRRYMDDIPDLRK